MTIGFVNSFIHDAAILAHSAIKALRPYQPWIATCVIAGKVFWRASHYKKLQNEIRNLNERIDLLEKIPNPSQPLEQELKIIQRLRDEKRFQQILGKWTFGQVPSLLFSHPGANPYQSLHQIFQRSYFMRQPYSGRSWNGELEIAAGAVCIAGTCAALLKQTGWIAEKNELALRIMHLALAVNLAEGAIMAKSLVENWMGS